MSSEVVPHSKEHAPSVIDFAKRNELLHDPATRRDFFENLDGDGFIDYVQQLAATVRTGDWGARQAFDGDKVRLNFHAVPDQRDKQALLYESWGTALRFLKDRSLSDEDALTYAALTAAGGLLYAHPFIDGNGRTSRVLSYLMVRGNEAADELEGIIAESSSSMWQVTPLGLRLRVGEQTKGPQPDAIDWEFQFAGEGEDGLDGHVVNSSHETAVVREFIASHSATVEPLVAKCSTVDPETGETHLQGDDFIRELVNEADRGIANAKALIDIVRELRARDVRLYLGAMLTIEPIPLVKNVEFSLGPKPDSEFAQQRHAIVQKENATRGVAGKMTVRDQSLAVHRGFSTVYHDKQQLTK